MSQGIPARPQKIDPLSGFLFRQIPQFFRFLLIPIHRQHKRQHTDLRIIRVVNYTVTHRVCDIAELPTSFVPIPGMQCLLNIRIMGLDNIRALHFDFRE